MLELTFHTPWSVLRNHISYRDIQRYMQAIEHGWMWVEARPQEPQETWEEQFQRARSVVDGQENNW